MSGEKNKCKSAGPQRRVIPLNGDELAVETVYGFFLVVPSWNVDVALGIIRDGIIEPWTNEVFLSLLRPGDKVVNVGANFGYYSALAAQRVGSQGCVYAIDANPVVFPYLVKGMFWSGYTGIMRCYNLAAVASDSHQKPLKFAYDPQFIGGGNLFSRARIPRNHGDCFWSSETVQDILDADRMFIPRGLYREIETEGRTLDSFIKHPVNSILIDAEGSESFVISGARELITRSPELSLIMEWDPHHYRQFPEHRQTIDDMWNFLLEDQKFTVRRICPENYAGVGQMPKLEPITREGLFSVPHSDLLLTRSSRG